MQHSLAVIAYLFFSRFLSANKESTRVFGVCDYGALGFALRVFRVKVLRRSNSGTPSQRRKGNWMRYDRQTIPVSSSQSWLSVCGVP